MASGRQTRLFCEILLIALYALLEKAFLKLKRSFELVGSRPV